MVSEFPKKRKTFSFAVLVYRICAIVLETKCAPVNLLRPTHKLALGRTSASGGRSTSSVQVSLTKKTNVRQTLMLGVLENLFVVLL